MTPTLWTVTVAGVWFFAGCWVLALAFRAGCRDLADAVGVAAGKCAPWWSR